MWSYLQLSLNLFSELFYSAELSITDRSRLHTTYLLLKNLSISSINSLINFRVYSIFYDLEVNEVPACLPDQSELIQEFLGLCSSSSYE